MKAGPELDAAIAEKVMGWKRVQGTESGAWMSSDGKEGRYGSWSPSTDIAAAWEVVEKAKSICLDRGAGYKTYQCCFNGSIVVADTAPLAICQAALRAVGEE